jgi:hypothetical protein
MAFVESGYRESGHRLCLMPSLKLDRGKHGKRRVTALAVMEDLEVLEIAFACSTRVRQALRPRSSTCIRLQSDSIMAFSKQLPTQPIEGRRPELRAPR